MEEGQEAVFFQPAPWKRDAKAPWCFKGQSPHWSLWPRSSPGRTSHGAGSAAQHPPGWEAGPQAYSKEEGPELPFPEVKSCQQSNGSSRREICPRLTTVQLIRGWIWGGICQNWGQPQVGPGDAVFAGIPVTGFFILCAYAHNSTFICGK